MCENRNQETEKQKIYLVGIGMGAAASMTGRAAAAIERCDYLIGARRMLETFRETRRIRQNPEKPGILKVRRRCRKRGRNLLGFWLEICYNVHVLERSATGRAC